MEISQAVELFVKYGLMPLIIGISTMAWHMHKKHETRLDILETKTTEIEKAVIEIRAEFKYTSRDIKEIKEMLHKMMDK